MRKIISFLFVFFLFPMICLSQPFGLKTCPKGGVLSSPNGRYVFGQISDSSKDQYMLDTWTGRLWRMSENGEVGKFLLPIPYQIGEGKYSYLPPEIKKNKKSRKRRKK